MNPIIGIAASKLMFEPLKIIWNQITEKDSGEFLTIKRACDFILDVLATRACYAIGGLWAAGLQTVIYGCYEAIEKGDLRPRTILVKINKNFFAAILEFAGGKCLAKVMPLYQGQGCTEFMIKNMLNRMKWFTYVDFVNKKTAKQLFADYFVGLGSEEIVAWGKCKFDVSPSACPDAKNVDDSATEEVCVLQSTAVVPLFSD